MGGKRASRAAARVSRRRPAPGPRHSTAKAAMIYSVHQPHYLPYPGYLEKVAASDRFVFLEGVQYVRREYQNRNRVKGPDGPQWLTVPVRGEYRARIDEMQVDDSTGWRRKHIETLRRFYAHAPHLEELDRFAEVIGGTFASLAELTIATTSFFLDRFGITTPRAKQASLEGLPEEPNHRIAEIGRRLGAEVYLAGAGGRNYMDLAAFREAGIEVRWFEHTPRPYRQLHGGFLPHLGAIDLLLNLGPGGFRELYGNEAIPGQREEQA